MPDLFQSILDTLNQIFADNPVLAVAFSGFAIAIIGGMIALFKRHKTDNTPNITTSESVVDSINDGAGINNVNKNISSVKISNIEGGVQNSTIAGRDIFQGDVTVTSVPDSLRERRLNALDTTWRHITAIENEHSGVVRWNDRDAALSSDFDVPAFIDSLNTIVTHKEEIEKQRLYLDDKLFAFCLAYCLFYWNLGLLKVKAFTEMKIVDWQDDETINGILAEIFTPDTLGNLLSREKFTSYDVVQLLKETIAKLIEKSTIKG